MTQDREILKLIEEADPSDTAKLDEIDARVHNLIYPNDPVEQNSGNGEWYNRREGWTFHGLKYTRSLDALQEIAPKDWWFSLNQYGQWFSCNANWDGDPDNVSLHTHDAFSRDKKEKYKPQRSRSLVWLHAIIQAIDHERSQP